MTKKGSYRHKAGELGKKLLQAGRALDRDINHEIELLNKWTGDADELARIAEDLRLKALKLAEETDVAKHKKLEDVDLAGQIIQGAVTLAQLFQDEAAMYILSQDVEGYYEFNKYIQSDARIAALRRLPDIELQRLHSDWQTAVRTKVRGD